MTATGKSDELDGDKLPQSEHNISENNQQDGSPGQQNTSSSSTSGRPRTAGLPSGMIRHRGILASCIVLVSSFIGLSTLDLKSTVETSATLDRSFHLDASKQATLPGDFRYDPEGTGSDGLYSVIEYSWNGCKKGFVDKAGKVVIKPMFDDVGNFHEGVACAAKNLPNANTREWGFIDKTGKFVIEPKFTQPATFEHGTASVDLPGGKTQLIDKSGRVVFEPWGKSSLEKRGDLYVTHGRNGRVGLIDYSGKWITPPQYESIDTISTCQPERYQPTRSTLAKFEPTGFLTMSKDGKYGVMTPGGQVVFPPKFEAVVSFQNGHAGIRMDGKEGFADSTGKVVIEPRYDISSAYDDLIVVNRDGHWGLIDSSGKTVQCANFNGFNGHSGSKWLSNGLGAVLIGEKFGYLNSKGELLVKPTFDWAQTFSEGFATVLEKNSWHYIDTTGKMVGPRLATVSQFDNGKAAVTIPGSLYSFMFAKTIEQDVQAIESWKRAITKEGVNGDNDTDCELGTRCIE